MNANIAWLVAGVFLLGYEGWVILAKKEKATLSEGVWAACKKYPYIGFLAGALAGHLFWQDPSPECTLPHVVPVEVSK